MTNKRILAATMAALTVAATVPALAQRMPPQRLQPLRVAQDTLGDALDADTGAALGRAESARDGVALLFASPAFQWRT